jgi:uncharacterized membrane protein
MVQVTGRLPRHAFLAVTPMHDLMVTIGLLFSLAALLAATHVLYSERRWLLFGWGSICVALSLLSAATYYGNLFYGFLPVVQKISLVMCVGSMLSLHYTQFSRGSGREPSASA